MAYNVGSCRHGWAWLGAVGTSVVRGPRTDPGRWNVKGGSELGWRCPGGGRETELGSWVESACQGGGVADTPTGYRGA